MQACYSDSYTPNYSTPVFIFSIFYCLMIQSFLKDLDLINLCLNKKQVIWGHIQIQERIGQQVTKALMNYLDPHGAACIIEASHMCMRMRGVSKQSSTMVTSSLKGCFADNDSISRKELLNLVK